MQCLILDYHPKLYNYSFLKIVLRKKVKIILKKNIKLFLVDNYIFFVFLNNYPTNPIIFRIICTCFFENCLKKLLNKYEK